MEAKICPDGSSVGRVPPKCEFSPCPLKAGWTTFTDTDGEYEFQYPEDLGTKYTDAFLWPPKVTIETGEYACATTAPESSLPEIVAEHTVDGRKYCVKVVNEGAAGSVYSTYTYVTVISGKLVGFNFILRYPQCLNYDEPKQSECQAERASFNLDTLMDEIAQSFRLL